MSEINIHDYELVQWLTDWDSNLVGWSLNQNSDTYAIFIRVPDKYYVGSEEYPTTEQHRYFNMLRVPIGKRGWTVTLNFNKVPALVWDKNSDFLGKNKNKVLKDLLKAPRYFKVLENIYLNPKIRKKNIVQYLKDVVEIWE